MPPIHFPFSFASQLGWLLHPFVDILQIMKILSHPLTQKYRGYLIGSSHGYYNVHGSSYHTKKLAGPRISLSENEKPCCGDVA